jgi:predicted membrane protein
MEKKVVSEKGEKDLVAYILGVISIIFAFFAPIQGLVFAIVGLIFNKKQNTPLSKKAKKLNIIGIVLCIAMFIISLALTIYLTNQGYLLSSTLA